MIDLTKIEPVKTSSNALDYSLFIYGTENIGKTTFVHELFGEDVLFIATERRHNAISGAYVVNISGWTEFLAVLAQLQNPKVKSQFKAVCIDTVPKLAKWCEEHVLSQLGIEDFSDMAYGKGWSVLKEEWSKIDYIERLGYLPVYISHEKTTTYKYGLDVQYDEEDSYEGNTIQQNKKEDVLEIKKFEPDLSDMFKKPILRSVDNILFMNTTFIDGESKRVIQLREDVFALAGFSLEQCPHKIELSADVYRQTLENSVKLLDSDMVVSGREDKSIDKTDLDYKSLMKEIDELGKKLYESGNFHLVTETVENYLGVGGKVSALTEDDVVMVRMIKDDLVRACEELSKVDISE